MLFHPHNRHRISSRRVSFPLCTNHVVPPRFLLLNLTWHFNLQVKVKPCPQPATKNLNSNCGFYNINMCLQHSELRPHCYFTVKSSSSNFPLLTGQSSPLSKITSEFCEYTLQTYILIMSFQWMEFVKEIKTT